MEAPVKEEEVKSAPQEQWYVATAKYYWSRGHTEEEALAQLRKIAGFSKNKKLVGNKTVRMNIIPKGAKDPYVDGMGSITWSIGDADPHANSEGRWL